MHNQELFRNLETANTALRRKVAENRRLYRNLESIYGDTVRALGAAIDAKDPYTRGHSDRVARIAVAIGRALGLPEREINALRIASHLHDIGKIAVDNSILLKPGRLDQEEMLQIHRHPTVSYDILSNIAFPYPDVALIARHHHEWVDGSGYPDRLGPKRAAPGDEDHLPGRRLRRDDLGPPLPARAQAEGGRRADPRGRARPVRPPGDARLPRGAARRGARGGGRRRRSSPGSTGASRRASVIGSIERFLGELGPVHR